jgi:hypothetical protein
MGEKVASKVRTVKAPPFVENNVVAPCFELLKWLITMTWPERHVTEAKRACEIARRTANNFASDLSNADDNISAETLIAWHEEVLAPLLTEAEALGVIDATQLAFTLAYDERMISREIIAPARSLDEEACILKLHGGVKSGDRGTTVKDLDIIAARNDALKTTLGAGGVAVDYLSWGDDVVVLTNDARAKSAWFEVDEQNHLWQDRPEADVTYMSKRLPQGHSYFMRMVSRRINREPAEEPSDIVGAALSVRASYDTLLGVSEPHPWARHYFSTLESVAPRLRGAVSLARETTTLDLMRIYSSSRRPEVLGRKQFGHWLESGLVEEDTETSDEWDALSDLLITEPSTYSKQLDRWLPANTTESAIREEAARWDTKTLLRTLARKR